MDWKNLFQPHILERGYDYYCEGAVSNLETYPNAVTARVEGSKYYNVEISLENGEISDIYCSCPYADGGGHCKHMAAVLYAWEDMPSQKFSAQDSDLFAKARTADTRKKKLAAVQALMEEADISVVKAYLTSLLMENEKLLMRFHSMVREKGRKEDIRHYIRQVDALVNRYLGSNYYISYYEADSFVSELEDILDEDVRRMMDDGQYENAFQLMNHIFLQAGEADMDDSSGGILRLAEQIYQMWLELLEKVSADEKQRMFQWFTGHLDGSVIDYLEENIERIVMEEFREEEYIQPKLLFVQKMIQESESPDSGWTQSYRAGNWAVHYLQLLEAQKCSGEEIENFCRSHWKNASVRKYYIDRCIHTGEYASALKALDESIALDQQHRGSIAEYSRKKKEIYLLQGNQDAYIRQLWELLLQQTPGDLDTFRELRDQYGADEWIAQREEIFRRLPAYAHIEQLYQEEKLHDKLLDFVLQSAGIQTLLQYTDDLKQHYPDELLQKYRDELNQLATYSGDRRKYQEFVSILRTMQKISGGAKAVDEIVAEWKIQYKNRPAMMDELRKL